MGVNLTGMASGLDTDSIISQLMAIEQNKVTAVQMKQVKVQAHKDDLSTITLSYTMYPVRQAEPPRVERGASPGPGRS